MNCWNSGTITTTTTNLMTGSAGITTSGNGKVVNCLNVGSVVTSGHASPIIFTESGTQPGSTKLVNSYALDGCITGASSTYFYYGYDENGNRIGSGVSETQLQDGTVLAALNGGNDEDVWGQLDNSNHPILLNNNNINKTQITISGLTAVNKVYDGTPNIGYIGTIITNPSYDSSKINVTYIGTLFNGTSYKSNETPVDSGDYVVTIAIPSTDLSYSGELKLSFKITPIVASDVATPSSKIGSLNQTLSDIELESGWNWADDSIVLSSNGTYEYDVYYLLTDEQLKNYDYSSINGFNSTNKRIERKVSVSVDAYTINFENCDDVEFSYGDSIEISGGAIIGNTPLVKDTDYTVEIYSIDDEGKVEELLLNNPTDVGKYLIYIKINKEIYDESYEIYGGEPLIIIGEDAQTLTNTYHCIYMLEITPITISVEHGPNNITYTSQEINARPVVKVGNVVLQENQDYEIVYYVVENNNVKEKLDSNPINVGKYLYVIELKGIYNNDGYELDGGIPTITLDKQIDEYLNYSACYVLTISNESIGGVDQDIVNELEQAINELKLALEDKADKIELSKAITDLTNLIENAVEEANKYSDSQDQLLKTELQNKINEANELIKSLDNRLSAAEKAILELQKSKEDLTKAINDGDKALDDKIIALNDSLEAAKTLLETADKDNKEALEKLINETKQTLEAAINKVQENLDKAQSDLTKAINDGDSELSDKISVLNKEIDNAKKVLEAADQLNNTELKNLINESNETLQKAIDALSLELENVKNELIAKDNNLQSFIIAVCVISCISLSECVALAVLLLKRKK